MKLILSCFKIALIYLQVIINYHYGVADLHGYNHRENTHQQLREAEPKKSHGTERELWIRTTRCGQRYPTAEEEKMKKEVLERWIYDHPCDGGKSVNPLCSKEESSRFESSFKISPIRILIHLHIIKHANGAGRVTYARVQSFIEVLNKAYKPRFVFYMNSAKNIDITTNTNWYFGKNVEAMQNKLKKGDCNDLNIYTIKPTNELMGWATYPWECRKNPTNDGVMIYHETLPGGHHAPFNLGMTLVHEVGHWLGLLHTFEGGCDGMGDFISDTPAEKFPSFGCPIGRDTCPGGGTDPVTNYMDYSDDSCMTHFTQGQIKEMLASFDAYRVPEPTDSPTRRPTSSPTPRPTRRPTKRPTRHPTKKPTRRPTKKPTRHPTKKPTRRPTKRPTRRPTKRPTRHPTKNPTRRPTKNPTRRPTNNPTRRPTKSPTRRPTKKPTRHPTKNPTRRPTKKPTRRPTKNPTRRPTNNPTRGPTKSPTRSPTNNPTRSPTKRPTRGPTNNPTHRPTSSPTPRPTKRPTVSPTPSPSILPTLAHSVFPSIVPTTNPSLSPTIEPTDKSSILPTLAHSLTPSTAPTMIPSVLPTGRPSLSPTLAHSQIPSILPTGRPSISPTLAHSVLPSATPSMIPSVLPTDSPSMPPTLAHSLIPSTAPSMIPSTLPSDRLSLSPTLAHSVLPSATPTMIPSLLPTDRPSLSPTLAHSLIPSTAPSMIPSTLPSDRPSISPTLAHSVLPSTAPSMIPSLLPTDRPSMPPTLAHSLIPSTAPSMIPSTLPSDRPSLSPTLAHSVLPSTAPSMIPSLLPSDEPSMPPTLAHSVSPVSTPSMIPSTLPSDRPSLSPTLAHSVLPTSSPTMIPSLLPTDRPSMPPTLAHSLIPTAAPSMHPTLAPVIEPTNKPSIFPTLTHSQHPSILPTMIPTITCSEFKLNITTPEYLSDFFFWRLENRCDREIIFREITFDRLHHINVSECLPNTGYELIISGLGRDFFNSEDSEFNINYNKAVVKLTSSDNGARATFGSCEGPAYQPNLWDIIIENDFEEPYDYGNFTSSGSNAKRYQGQFAHSGEGALYLRDGKVERGVHFSSDNINVKDYSKVRVSFWYYTLNMEGRDGFSLQYSLDGGASWVDQMRWFMKRHFENGVWNEQVEIMGVRRVNQIMIRFRGQTDSKRDKLLIDDVVVSAKLKDPSNSKSPEELPDGLQWVLLFFNDFENPEDWGLFRYDGPDARRSVGQYFRSGEASIFLRDGRKKTASIVTSPIDISTYDMLRVKFWYYPWHMEGMDGFLLEYSIDNENSWVEVKHWKITHDFQNDAWYEEKEYVLIEEFNSIIIRFRCFSNTKRDKVFFDDIEFSATNFIQVDK